jgi:hypothetical protein
MRAGLYCAEIDCFMEWWRGLAHPHPAWGSLYTYQNHPKTFKKCLDKRPTKCQKWADNVMTKVRTSFRFEEGDIEGWKRAAEREGLTLSEWMRRRLNGAGSDNSDVPRVRAVRAGGGGVDAAGGDVVRSEPEGRGRTCVHGVGKGYHCWQCKGLAEVGE